MSPQTIALFPSGPWPNHPLEYPKERELNREALLDVAPDREDLLMSNKSVHELRQMLKIRIEPGCVSHWLYRNRKRMNASLRDGNSRISTLLGDASIQKELTSSRILRRDGASSKNLRRVLSTSSISPLSAAMDARLCRTFGDSDIDIWGCVVLSNDEKLISPRPLGPTHILIIHSITGTARPCKPITAPGRRPLRRRTSSVLSNVVELPINDLLFALNVPNIDYSISTLPPRLHKELPRVLMYVPHLDTFPELVVYLHTQNQAELFRSLVPEWIRDLLHPLPEFGIGGAMSAGITRSAAKTPRQLFGILIPGSTLHSNVGTMNPDTYPGIFEYKRTVKAVAQEIAEAAQAAVFKENDDADPILRTVARLNALKDNLEHIGYFGNMLWSELDVYRDVLVRSVSCQARLRAAVDLEE
ncbi:hypothetical protein H0H81_009593 [Sphagnurus paluster]|uniref:Uncharacterized protein n=1 Tax=Sphagnurus paluster TaxID=117069 RepID=A0A9P7FS00_9AGAR|nr:hypothetical protein H0H81_009593 [Sphagnurus paluster]